MQENLIMEAMYILRMLIERYRMKRRNIFTVFIDLVKAYNKIPREITSHIL